MNYETVKMFGMESEEVSAYSDLQNEYMKKFILFRFSLNALNFGQSTIQALGLGASMILAARRTALGGLTAGDFVLINTYVSQLYQPLFVCTAFSCFEGIPALSFLTPYVVMKTHFFVVVEVFGVIL